MLSYVVNQTIAKVGKSIVLGAPLGIGKPHPVLNAFYQHAKQHPEIQLHIYTALSLNKPSAGSGLQKRFLQPFLDRHFGKGYPNLDYVRDLKNGTVPNNIQISEFYMLSGSMLGKPLAQQNYLSSNYTHVARDMAELGVNVICQLVAKQEVDGETRYSLSSNPDVTLDLMDRIAHKRDQVMTIALVNSSLPYMGEDAEVAADFFDEVIDDDQHDYRIFGIPREPVTPIDHAIGIHASALIKDAGTLQIGIGALGDAICHALRLRHQDNDQYRRVINSLQLQQRYAQLLNDCGDLQPFSAGLYAASEMFMDGFLHLHDAGILERKVYDDVGLQSVLNTLQPQCASDCRVELLQALANHGVIHHQLRESDIDWLKHWGLLQADTRMSNGQLQLGSAETPAVIDNERNFVERIQVFLGPGLLHGKRLHAAFFAGSSWFYDSLNAMTQAQRDEFMMTRVSRINQLYRGEELDRVQRQRARFVNTCMKMTLLGAAVSDQLADGQVVSGVGGQYNFVAMAHALDNSRSILMLRSSRKGSNGLESNIVWEYPHHTIPRHLRDIVITEYGIADLRSQTDNNCIKQLLCISDSRFQTELMQQARQAGKLETDWSIPAEYQSNLPENLQQRLPEFAIPRWPFGSDLTETEQRLAKALQWLAAQPKWKLLPLLIAPGDESADIDAALQRMQLQDAKTWKDRLSRRLVKVALVRKF